jgi:hypothetical protein
LAQLVHLKCWASKILDMGFLMISLEPFIIKWCPINQHDVLTIFPFINSFPSFSHYVSNIFPFITINGFFTPSGNVSCWLQYPWWAPHLSVPAAQGGLHMNRLQPEAEAWTVHMYVVCNGMSCHGLQQLYTRVLHTYTCNIYIYIFIHTNLMYMYTYHIYIYTYPSLTSLRISGCQTLQNWPGLLLKPVAILTVTSHFSHLLQLAYVTSHCDKCPHIMIDVPTMCIICGIIPKIIFYNERYND